MIEEIKKAFESISISFEDDYCERYCQEIMSNFSIRVQQLIDNYEIYMIKNNIKYIDNDNKITRAELKKFENYLKKELNTTSDIKKDMMEIDDIKIEENSESIKNELNSPLRSIQRLSELSLKTPITHFSDLSETTSISNSIYASEKNIQYEIINHQIPNDSQIFNQTKKQLITYNENRIMEFIKKLEEIESIDATNKLLQHYMDAVWVCGIIHFDPKLKNNMSLSLSIELEGSMTYTSSQHINLDISHLKSYSLFPGQVIAANVINPTGKILIVKDIICHLPPVPMPLSVSLSVSVSVEKMNRKMFNNFDIKICIASGPYTKSDDFTYTPLLELQKECLIKNFDIIILIGPFVDEYHPYIHNIEMSYQSIFNHQVIPIIKAIADTCGKVFVIPSIRDIFHFPIFPTPSFHPFDHDKIITCSNPSIIKICDCINIAISSLDIIKDLDMISHHNIPSNDNYINMLIYHLIGQNNFYPMMYSAMNETCLNVSYKDYFKFDMIPDILIMPSDLIQSSMHMISDYYKHKTMDNDMHYLSNSVFTTNQCMYINPGRLVNYDNENTLSGSYAILNIKKNKEYEIFNLENKCDVEFIK